MIYFISNFNITLLWNRIISELKQENIEAKHLFTSPFLYDYLKKLSPNEIIEEFDVLEEIQDINKNMINKYKKEIDSLLQHIDQTFDGFLKNDRYLCQLSKRKATIILIKAYIAVKSFIKNHKIDFIVGEVTNIHEVLFYCFSKKYNNFKFLYLHNLRLLPNKVSFFNYDFSFDYEILNLINLENKEKTDINYELIIEYGKYILNHRNFNSKKVEKKFFIQNRNKINTHDIQYLLNAYIRLTNFYNKIYKLIDKAIKKVILFLFNKKIIKDLEKLNEKYIYYPLHVVPEATVNIVAPSKVDQKKNIFNLLKKYNDYIVIFKPHPNGDSLKFLDYIKLLVNKRVFITFLKSQKLLKKADIVYTISGTAGLEALMKGKKVIIDSTIFFSKHPLNINYKGKENFLNNLKYFNGFFQDPILYDNVLKEENIKKLANIFKGLYK
jgi:hypothetical protein